MTHSFWQGGLQALAHELEGSATEQTRASVIRESFRQSVARFSVRDSMSQHQLADRASMANASSMAAAAEQRVADAEAAALLDQTGAWVNYWSVLMPCVAEWKFSLYASPAQITRNS